jgi:hypothetical protein
MDIMKHLIEAQWKEICTYELKDPVFVLLVKRIGVNIPDIAEELLEVQRILEYQVVEKIDCMYVTARLLSLPSVDAYLKEYEKYLDFDHPNIEHSAKLNSQIDKYFLADEETSIL